MSKNGIRGITIELSGNTTGLQAALKDVNKESRDLQSELKQVDRLLKLDPSNTELLAQKQKLLADSIESTKKKLDTLKEAEKQVQQQFKDGKVSEEQYRALQREIVGTEQKLQSLESQGRQTQAVLSEDQAVGNLKNIGVAIGGAVAGATAAMAGMANAAMENADELQRQADVTGLSAERLQEFQYIGNNLGVSLDTITGAQAKLTKSMDAAREGTGAQAEAFAKLGVNVLDGEGNLRNANEVMLEAFNALNSVGSEADRDALAMQLFGKSAMEMNPLIKAGSDEINRLTQEARDNGAVMSNEAVSGLDTLGDTIDNLKTSILGAFANKLNEILPNIQAFVDKLMQLPQWIQENSTKLTLLGVGIGTVMTLVIAFNIQQALLASGMTLWTAIAGAATTVTTALGTAFAFLTSPIGLVILAIGAVVAAGVLLIKHWDEVKNLTLNIWNAISTTVGGAIESIKGIINGVVLFFQATWASIVSFFTEGIPKFIQNVIQWINNLPYNLGLAIGTMIGTLIQFGVDAWNWVTTEIPKIINGIIQWFASLPGKIWNFLVSVVTKFGEWKSNLINWIAINLPKIINNVIDWFKGLPGKVWNEIIKIKDKFVSLKDALINWAKTALPGFITTFVDFMKELPSKMLDIGKNIVSGIWNGIKSRVNWLTSKVKSFSKGIVDGIKRALGISSPSKVFADVIGKNMAAGIGLGFENEMKNVSTNMSKLLIPQISYRIPSSTIAAGAGSAGNVEIRFDNLINIEGNADSSTIPKIQQAGQDALENLRKQINKRGISFRRK